MGVVEYIRNASILEAKMGHRFKATLDNTARAPISKEQAQRRNSRLYRMSSKAATQSRHTAAVLT